MKRAKLSGEEEGDESPHKNKDLPDPSVVVNLFDTHILTIPLIADLVFADLSYSDLLNCSLVSKAWNLTCRRLLVDSFRTYLTLSEKSTVQSLEDFYSLIRDVIPGHEHPVNGIRIQFEARVRRWPFSYLLALISGIMKQMQFKCVSLEMSNLHLKARDYHLIFKTLVIPHISTIKFMEILDFGGNLRALSKQLNVDSLLNLRELNLGNSLDQLKSSTFERILKACPSLRTFPAVFPYQLPTLRDTHKLHLASKVRFNYMRFTPEDLQQLEEVECSALIRHLDINQHYEQQRNQYEGEFISKLRVFFTTHLPPNLECLDIDLEPLVAILQSPMPPLLNIRKLCCRGGQRFFPCLFHNKNIPFAQFLPNLKSMTLLWTPIHSEWLHMKYRSAGDRVVDVPISLLKCAVPASLDSVTVLKLHDKYGCSPNEALTKIMDLHEVFPCVTHLDIRMNLSGLEDFLKWICESWGDVLETLIIRGTKCLGFHPESPMELRPVWRQLTETKRKPPGTVYSDKLSHLRRLELEFQHPMDTNFAGFYFEEKKLQAEFEPREGQKVQLIMSGCRAKKRMQSVMYGVSIYDTILGLHSCPRNLELSPMEEILAENSICRTICEMLHTADLRSCRLVNRCWNAVAQEVFRERGSFTLSLNPLDLSERFDKPRNLHKFLWFAEGNQKLFNRLRIECLSDCKDEARFYTFAEAIGSLLERFDFTQTCFKELEVGYFQFLNDSSQFPNLMINVFKNLFQKLNVHRVQKLVTRIEIFDKLFRDEEGNLLFKNLQNIEILNPEKLHEHPHVFKKLLQDLNRLKRVELPFHNELLPLMSSAGRAHCVKQVKLFKSPRNLSYSYKDSVHVSTKESWIKPEDPRTELRFLQEFVERHEPRIERLSIGNDVELFGEPFQRFELEPVLRRIFQRLFTSSSESLQTLKLNLPFLHFIFGLIPRPLVALKTIGLLFDEAEFDSQRLLAQIPFSDVASNLEDVKITRVIHASPDSVPGEPSTPERLDLMPIQTFSSVKSLEYKIKPRGRFSPGWIVPWSSELETMENLARVFPNISKFSFFLPRYGSRETEDGFPAVLSLIYKSWPGLEILEVGVGHMDIISFEASLLGISMEELSAWKKLLGSEHELDALTTMHYAPSSPSMRSCKNLKVLRSSRYVSKLYGKDSQRKLRPFNNLMYS